ncbi:MAG: tRNA adenosine(34) deaminase TadA [Acidobacteria bacterium]|nr:tRNA adenosine(34) deaminase TadA [Acidobacteriota bacterium]
MSDETDERWMRVALEEADRAAALGEVPVGAVLVGPHETLLAKGHNLRELNADPTAHAEIVTMRDAAKARGLWRLEDTTLYVTLEPCAMCAGALVHARVERLVYGAPDERFGAVETVFRICDGDVLNHRIEIAGGILAEECRRLMQDFFRRRREIQRSQKNIDLPT